MFVCGSLRNGIELRMYTESIFFLFFVGRDITCESNYLLTLHLYIYICI